MLSLLSGRRLDGMIRLAAGESSECAWRHQFVTNLLSEWLGLGPGSTRIGQSEVHRWCIDRKAQTWVLWPARGRCNPGGGGWTTPDTRQIWSGSGRCRSGRGWATPWTPTGGSPWWTPSSTCRTGPTTDQPVCLQIFFNGGWGGWQNQSFVNWGYIFGGKEIGSDNGISWFTC